MRLEVVDGEGGPDRVDVSLNAGALGTRRTVSQTTRVLRSVPWTVDGRRFGIT